MSVAVGLVLVACFLAALFSGLELHRIGWGMRMARRSPEHDPRTEAEWKAWEKRVDREEHMRTWLSMVLIASLGIAATIAVLEGAVETVFHDSFAREDTITIEQSEQSRTLSAAERAAFGGRVTKHYLVPRKTRSQRLCLMRYAERGFGDSRLSGKWWTSCQIARSLGTVADVKEDLALPARFGAVRDARVKALIPTGTYAVFFEGRVAPQCEHESDELPCRGHRYEGGSWQYFFPSPEQIAPWIKGAECTRAREDRPSRWAPCAG